MAKSSYKLNQELLGHTEDVRALDVGINSIVSASRDKTAILWKFQDGHCVENIRMEGHSNFVSSVCIIHPTQTYPKGLIVTGSQDCHICVYLFGEIKPIHKIKAHENSVCCLKRSSIDENSFLSSSWDISAKLWNLNNLEIPQVTYLGHSAAVWSVADLPNSSVVTGAADKTVIIYTRDGKILHRLKDHTDCVRDICIINDDQFLTCANDAVIKHWNAVSGKCIGNFYGHSNYIYSVSANPGGTLAVSSGEDKKVIIWVNGEIDQTLSMPSQSVWSVKLLPNEDIVCGTSDGVVRIFTTKTDRYADAETLQKFEESVANFEKKNEQDLGLKNISDISALSQPGKKDGETKLIKEGQKVKAYSWSQRELKWNLIGDVMGSDSNSSKQFYNGLEYDYVFSVDIQDGVPPLKLPYNNGEDPWHAAQKFIDDNQLSQYYLETVANFIIKNSAPAQVVNAPSSQFYDPFTGGNRYIPSSGDTTQPASVSKTSAQQRSSTQPVSDSNQVGEQKTSYLPLTNYLKLEQCNLDAVRGKLQDFNSNEDEIKNSINNNQLESLVKLATVNFSEAIDSGAINTLVQLLNWPDAFLFPILDIARLAVLHKNVNDKVCTEELINLLRRHLYHDSLSSNQMLTYRLLANMFYHEAGEKLGLQFKDEIIQSMVKLCTKELNKSTQIAMSTYILNLVLATNKNNNFDDKKVVLRSICELMQFFNDREAMFRILVALGTLLSVSSENERSEMVQNMLEFENILNLFQSQPDNSSQSNPIDKVENVKQEIYKFICSN